GDRAHSLGKNLRVEHAAFISGSRSHRVSPAALQLSMDARAQLSADGPVLAQSTRERAFLRNFTDNEDGSRNCGDWSEVGERAGRGEASSRRSASYCVKRN